MKKYVFTAVAGLAALAAATAGTAAAAASEVAASAPALTATAGVLPAPAVVFVDPLAASAMGQAARDLSPVGMFQAADLVVQSVILTLLFASLVSWVIGVAKWVQLRNERRRLAQAMSQLRSATDLARVGETGYAPISDMVVTAEDEIAASTRSGEPLAAEGIKDRIEIRFDRLVAGLQRHAGRSVGALAIISSTAPFVGLFGTVWGIMNSFIGIAQSHSTSLAVVAPGIAEALLTTAVGLMAAIPAAILYNVFARVLSNYAGELGDAGVAVLCLAGREVDQAQGRG